MIIEISNYWVITVTIEEFFKAIAIYLYTNSQLPTHRFFEPGVSVQGWMHFGMVHPSSMSKYAPNRDGLVAICHASLKHHYDHRKLRIHLKLSGHSQHVDPLPSVP